MVDKSQWIEPDAGERERLYVLAEELMESALLAGQMAMKTLRFGYAERYPEQLLANRERLEHELGDVLGVVQLMIDAGDVSELAIQDATAAKAEKLKVYTMKQAIHLRACKKFAHPSADAAADHQKKLEHAGKGKFKSYQCEKCGRYHVAHAKPKHERGRRR